MKRIFLFGMIVLAASLFVFGALVNAAPAAQENAPATATPALQEQDTDAESAPVAPGTMTSQIVIFNPDTSGEATVQIDIYNAGGDVAYTTTENVAANGAKLLSLPGTLGANFQGGAQISSDKNVQALVVGANGNKTARDEYEGTISPALDVTLPLVRHLAANTQNTQLAIQNTTSNAATVTATFYNADGSMANTQNLNIAAHQSAYLNTNTLFPNTTFVGSARIVSNQTLAVTAQTSYNKDTAAFNGMATSDAATELYLNQVQRKINNGGVGVNWSEIFVRNNGANATDITVDFYSAAGALVTSTTASAVPANGAAQFSLKDAAFAALGANYNGWARIASNGEALTAAALQVLNKSNRLYSANALANNALGSRYVCGDTARMSTQNSQIQILNTDAIKNAKVLIRLYNPETGAKLVQVKVSVAAQSTATVLLSDSKFAAAGTNYQGMALIQVKGGAPPNILVSVNNPYANPKLSGTTGYTCSKL